MKMKTLFFSICMSVPTLAATAQDIPQKDVPSIVLNAFQSKFTDVTDLEWEVKGELYKAEFEVGTRDHDLWIDKNGNITKHKEDFPKSQLPAAIRKTIETEFKDYSIDDADKIETDGKVYYQVDLDSRSGDRDVFFTPDGKIYEGNI